MIRTPRYSPRSKASYGTASETECSQDHEAFQRRELRASVYDTYTVVSALLAGVGVCTVSIDHKTIVDDYKSDHVRYWLLIVHQTLVRICTALAIFATVVFAV